MKKIGYGIATMVFLVLCTHQARAGQIKAYVSGFAVTGAQNKDELKTALQTLLMSRLNNETVITVESQAGTDITVTGSYVAFGTIFSLDAAAKDSAGNVVARAFVQGDNQEELIPAIGKLAKTLADTIAKAYPATGAVQPAIPRTKGTADMATKEIVAAAPPSDIVRPQAVDRQAGSAWVSQRIRGVMSGFAVGRTFANGDRVIFMAGPHTLQHYRIGKEMQLVAEATLDINDKILSIDTADLDGDGMPEVYATVMNGNALVSQVWIAVDNKLKKVADNLPYFLRGIAFKGKEKKIYAQQINLDEEFFGD